MRTDAPAAARQLEDYLRRFRFALSPLPPEEREEIIRELRSHFLERMNGAPDPVDAFHATAEMMGTPEDYARSFLDDYRISAAMADGSGFAMLHQALRMVGRGTRALVGAAFFLSLFAISLAFFLTAVLKPVFPENIGAWFAPEQGVFGVGFVDAESAARAPDLLGYWIIPVNILVALLLYRVGIALLRPFLSSFRSSFPEQTPQ